MMEVKNRDYSIDILKGIAIVLMVIGHSGIGEGITRFIYLFHMAVFVIASGYCYNDKYSTGQFHLFLKRRIKTLYLPYVMYMLGLVLLHNILIKWNIYTDSALFLEGNYGNGYGAMSYYSLKEVLVECVKSFFLLGGEQLFGAAWFIRVLFCMSILWCIIDSCLVRLCKKKLMMARILISILFLAIGYAMSQYNILNFSNIPAIFTAYILFAFGVCMKEFRKNRSNEERLTHLILKAITSLLVLVIIFLTGININMAVFDNVFLYCIASLAGWNMLYAFSKLLLKCRIGFFARVLTYLGQNTMPIVLFHFIAFKLITLMEIIVYQLPMMRLASFPIYKGYPGWWILYTLVGVIVPIGMAKGWNECINRMKLRFKEKKCQ